MNPLHPIAATSRDSAAGATAPPPSLPAALPHSGDTMLVDRSFKVVAASLDVSPRQAQILVAIASGCADRAAICRAIGITDSCLKVHVSNLRKQHWNIYTRRRLSYFLSADHHALVVKACRTSAASPQHMPPVGVSSRQTAASANAGGSFQPSGDLTRQDTETHPHS